MTQNFLQTTSYSAAMLKRLSDQGQLDIRPPFQRNPVWLDGQKSYLIDTILRGYPVPEMYLQVTTSSSGEERHVVVDGQQRITAVLQFLEGDYSLSGLEATWDGSSFEDLSDAERGRIFAYTFVVRVLPELSEEEVRAIFQRLNRNVVALSRQELRHATYWGEFIMSMESIATNPFWGRSGIFTANEVRRMLDVEFVSELAVAHIHGPQNKKLSLERWYQIYEEEFAERAEVEAAFLTVLGEIEQLLPDISKTRWSKKSDFYTLFLYLSSRARDLPLASEVRSRVEADLRQFAREVDEVLSLSPTDSAEVVQTVVEYARAVQRAASDLSPRRVRAANLAAFLSGDRTTVVLNADNQEEEAEIIEEDVYDTE